MAPAPSLLFSSTTIPNASATATTRLAVIAQHVKGNASPIASRMANEGKKLKVVVCRDLGPDVMPLLQKREELEVSASQISFNMMGEVTYRQSS